ncbi:MAG: glycoside hydrolase family 36 protein, partial [Steroidobacteraceae bacterium]
MMRNPSASTSGPVFNAGDLSLSAAGILLSELAPLIDGQVPECGPAAVATTPDGWTVTWLIAGAGERVVLAIVALADADGLMLDLALEGAQPGSSIDSLGLRIGAAANVLRYLRNGYMSWDGSFFIEPDSARGVVERDPRSMHGHAMTALLSRTGDTAVLGFLRHDRFQSSFRFAFAAGPLSIEVETLIDQVAHRGRVAAETLVLLSGAAVEEVLRNWARRVAEASPLPPRVRAKRISGWCSWYNLYASVSESLVLEHLRAAARFRDRHQVPLEVFQIDDGFTPEMGDWLEVKPQFPRGMKSLLDEIRAAGFVPGLWIAPLMVGNRSRLYAEHPDWVVMDRVTGKPLAPLAFYSDYRWHKRSEEYYVLDITHPGAEAYMREVFRIWRNTWGCEYFKTDFMHFGCDYGPKRARRHVAGLSRIEIWMRMARLIREEIGDALWLGCGSPIWAPVGLIDAVRIGRDVGTAWKGNQSAESLLRDQTARNFANGILWQSDPDCVLLRDRFHDLTDDQVDSLAMFAGLAGGILMTSDQLDEVPAQRQVLFAQLLRAADARTCDFPRLGLGSLRYRVNIAHTGMPTIVTEGDPVLVQRAQHSDGGVLVNLFNTGDLPADRLIEWETVGLGAKADVQPLGTAHRCVMTAAGVHVSLPPYVSCQLLFSAGV